MPTTGTAVLPDIGTLAYNGVTFTSLFRSHISANAVKDNAGRTVKWVEITLEAEGYVTLNSGETTIDNTMKNLRQLLQAQGGTLTYSGKGLGQVVINLPGGGLQDMNWGPKPELLDFQPLGASRSALIKWTITTCISELQSQVVIQAPIVQFNEETSLTYDEEGYSGFAIKGTLEIPLTRMTQATRSLEETADDFRKSWLEPMANSIDLQRFRVTRRTFSISRDKRILEWEFAAEELGPHGLVPGVTMLRGDFTVDQAKTGTGACQWICTLSCTYTLRNDAPRRLAWWSFISLLAFRMRQADFGNIPGLADNTLNGQNPQNPVVQFAEDAAVRVYSFLTLTSFWDNQMRVQQQARPQQTQRAIHMRLRIKEGIGPIDSKRITFTSTYRLTTTFSNVLIGSGVWRYTGAEKLWATSIREVMGSNSWLVNSLDPNGDFIVDFGGGSR
jgi:hypothetical protein